jgi:hypothetical protein
MGTPADRKAENEAIFRDANEEIAAVRQELNAPRAKTPFFCECDDPACREIVRLGVDEYEAVRASPATFVLAQGHACGDGRIVAERDTYVVVEKEGRARQIAIETDPRTDDG